MYAVKVSGTDVKNWLETAAKRFNRIDPTKATVQPLVSTFPGYNFDMFTPADLAYEIDVTQPVGSRIKNLTYKGAAIDPNAQFIVATNNYHRASGGGNPRPRRQQDDLRVARREPRRADRVRQASAVRHHARGRRRVCSWRFTKLAVSVAHVQFASAPNRLYAARGPDRHHAGRGRRRLGQELATYEIDLTQ